MFNPFIYTEQCLICQLAVIKKYELAQIKHLNNKLIISVTYNQEFNSLSQYTLS